MRTHFSIRIVIMLILCIVVVGAIYLRLRHRPVATVVSDHRIKIVATTFPVYLTVQAIGGERVNLSMLIPPGAELHDFEPSPRDIKDVQQADIFAYAGDVLEPWVEDVFKDIPSTVHMLDTSYGVALQESLHQEGVLDPHYWLDIINARIMTEQVTRLLASVDPANASYYQRRADQYLSALADLDRSIHTSLAHCKSRILIHAGHSVFGYLARRYDLDYHAATGVSGHEAMTAQDIATLISLIRSNGIDTIFVDIFEGRDVADTIATETGVRVLALHSLHTISPQYLRRGETFLHYMQLNREALVKGLHCR